MNYSQPSIKPCNPHLIQFDPIESIIQLQEADDKQEAVHLVKTYSAKVRSGEESEAVAGGMMKKYEY